MITPAGPQLNAIQKEGVRGSLPLLGATHPRYPKSEQAAIKLKTGQQRGPNPVQPKYRPPKPTF